MMKRCGAILVVFFCLVGHVLAGGTRLASVYIESSAALQGQLLQAAQLFEAPELGMAPMMMSMMIPGFTQIDRDAPIGVHMYAGGAEKVGFVVSLKPAVSPEAFLGAWLATQGLALPEPIDGRYVLETVAAQMDGTLLLIGRNVQDLELALQTGIPAALPVVPGMIRLDVAPASLVAILQDLEGLALDAMPADAEQRKMLQQGMGLYRRGLAQVASFQYGIGVSEQGLVLRSRILPQPGRALEGIVQSLQAVDQAWVAQLEGNRLLGVVSGAYTVPEDVVRSVLDMYMGWMKTLPAELALDPALIRAMFEPSMATVGAPTFMFGGLNEAGKLDLYGGVLVENAVSLLQQMMELTASEMYQEQVAASGMKVSAPVARVVNDTTVFRWNVEIDEEVFFRQMREAGAAEVDADALVPFKTMMDMFFSGYDYAATGEGLVYGVTDDAGIAKAMGLLGGTEAGASTLWARMGAPVAPYMVARLDLLGFMHAAQKLGASPLPVVAGPGEGVLLAGWRSGVGVEQMMLIPAADIRVLRAAGQAAAQAAAQ